LTRTFTFTGKFVFRGWHVVTVMLLLTAVHLMFMANPMVRKHQFASRNVRIAAFTSGRNLRCRVNPQQTAASLKAIEDKKAKKVCVFSSFFFFLRCTS
jgi:hypothetical protein